MNQNAVTGAAIALAPTQQIRDFKLIHQKTKEPDEQEKIITDFYKEHGRSGLAPNDHIITQPREAEEALQNIFLKKWSEKKTETVYSIVRQRENEKLEELNRRKKELESVYEKEKLLYAEQGTLFDMNSL